MPPEQRKRPAEPQVEEQLKFIRDVMERSGTFTAVPGLGTVTMGICAVIAAYICSIVSTRDAWLITWMVAAAVSASIGGTALVFKSKRAKSPLSSGPGRKFLASFFPPLFAGAVLTIALWHVGKLALLPGMWMLMYGTGVVAGGAFSVRIVPITGMLFLAAGAVTLFLPQSTGNLMMAITFGGYHIIFGLLITKYHGG